MCKYTLNIRSNSSLGLDCRRLVRKSQRLGKIVPKGITGLKVRKSVSRIKVKISIAIWAESQLTWVLTKVKLLLYLEAAKDRRRLRIWGLKNRPPEIEVHGIWNPAVIYLRTQRLLLENRIYHQKLAKTPQDGQIPRNSASNRPKRCLKCLKHLLIHNTETKETLQIIWLVRVNKKTPKLCSGWNRSRLSKSSKIAHFSHKSAKNL